MAYLKYDLVVLYLTHIKLLFIENRISGFILKFNFGITEVDFRS